MFFLLARPKNVIQINHFEYNFGWIFFVITNISVLVLSNTKTDHRPNKSDFWISLRKFGRIYSKVCQKAYTYSRETNEIYLKKIITQQFSNPAGLVRFSIILVFCFRSLWAYFRCQKLPWGTVPNRNEKVLQSPRVLHRTHERGKTTSPRR